MKPTKKHILIGWLTLGYLIICLYYTFFDHIVSEEYLATYHATNITDSDVGCIDDCLDSIDDAADDSTTDYNIMETN